MFFTTELLSKRDSGIGLLWMAATLGKASIGKLNRRNILKADIGKLCELVAEPAEPLALRLSSNLLVGVARVYKVKHDIFFSEVTTCFTSLKRTMMEISAAETSAALNMTFGSVRPDTITLAAPELGAGINLDFDFGGLVWEDFFAPLANRESFLFRVVVTYFETGLKASNASPSPGITTQDFTGNETQTQTQRPLYTLDEPHTELLAGGDAVDPVDLGLGLGLEEFDLGLGQDAFGDAFPTEDGQLINASSPKDHGQKTKAGGNIGTGVEPIYARESSIPVDPLNYDDWVLGVEPSSSGLSLPRSGGLVVSSRPGSRFQSHEPQAAGHLSEGPIVVQGAGAESIAPAAPKKPKKPKGVIQDTRTELGEDELTLENYLNEQKRLRAETDSRRQEQDAARVVNVWMDGASVDCPALDDWFRQSFKALVGENSRRRKRDKDDGFAAPLLPAKRRKEDTPSRALEIGRRMGTPMYFGDDYLNFEPGQDYGIPRGSSIEAAELGMRASRAASETRGVANESQKSSLLPWDDMGVSSSTNGDTGPGDLPGEPKIDRVTVKLRSSSRSRRESSVPLRLSASPGRFGPELDAFGEGFEFLPSAGERPSQTEVTLERSSLKFLEYLRMQERALVDSSEGVAFSNIVPVESSTAHVAAVAFYHTLVLATKSVVRVNQAKPLADFIVRSL